MRSYLALLDTATLRLAGLHAPLAGALVAALVACGSPQDTDATSDASHRGALSTALLQGRRVVAGDERPASNLDLALAEAVTSATEDAQSGSPRWVQFDTRAMKVLLAADVVPFALDYVAQSFAPGFALAGGLRLVDDALAVVSFTRAENDVPVRDAFVDLYFARLPDGNFKLRELTSRHAAALRLVNAGADAPTSSELSALASDSSLTVVSTRPVVFARELAPLTYEYVVATEAKLRDERTGETVVATVEDGEKTLLEAYSDRLAATVSAKAYGRSYRDPQTSTFPLAFAEVVAGGQTQAADALGTLATAPTGATQIRLTSPRARIVAAQNGSHTLNVANAAADTVVDPTALDQRAVNAYLAIQRVNHFTRRHLAQAEAPVLGTTIAVTLDVQGNCNAFYTNSSISLFRDGNGCANMALVNDVIYHEWGHGLDDTVGRTPGITDGAFSEGIGDIVASYLVDDAMMGTGFFTASTDPVRALKNTARYPEGRGEVHVEGQIIGGAFWDMRAALVQRYGAVKGAYDAERLFFRHLLTADSYLESYDAVVRLDDDDANPATRSPNFCLINKAFADHGLATLEADCTDDPEKLPSKADPTIVAGILERGAAGVKLMVSAENATTMRACTATCVDLVPEGVVGAKTVFVTSAALPLTEGALVKLEKLDANGAVRGKRTVKLVAQ